MNQQNKDRLAGVSQRSRSVETTGNGCQPVCHQSTTGGDIPSRIRTHYVHPDSTPSVNTGEYVQNTYKTPNIVSDKQRRHRLADALQNAHETRQDALERVLQQVPHRNPIPSKNDDSSCPADGASQTARVHARAHSVKIRNLPPRTLKIRTTEAKLLRFACQAEARRLLPSRPVARCRRIVGFNPETRRQYDRVSVMQSAMDGECYTGRLWACKSTWECPVCQAYRAAVFLERLLPLLEESHSRFEYGMETLTAASRAWMTVDEFVRRFKMAVEDFYSHRWRTNFDQRWHLRARVSGHDITIGENGPHDHRHNLLVADKGGFNVSMPDGRELWVADHMNETVTAMMWQEAAPRWVKCCETAGLYADWEHGYHIEGANKNAAHYIAKLAFEVGLYANKTGRGGRTMGELLLASRQGDELAGRQWVEITKALKGSAYLRASKGLWELLGGAEPTKQELDSGEESTCDRLIAELEKRQWYQILKDNKRQEWLTAQAMGPAELAAWCVRNGFQLELVEPESEE